MDRKLSTILAADVVDYSALMERDEAGAFQRLRAGRKELFEPESARHPDKDLLAIQTEIPEQLASRLGGCAGVVQEAGRISAHREPPENLNAYELYLLGTEKLERSTSQTSTRLSGSSSARSSSGTMSPVIPGTIQTVCSDRPPSWEAVMRATCPGFRNVLTDVDIRAVLAFIKRTWPERERARQAEMSSREQERCNESSPDNMRVRPTLRRSTWDLSSTTSPPRNYPRRFGHLRG
jgi:hypothetical protein